MNLRVEESLIGFANMACRDLPQGWGLVLSLENGAGDFDLTDPHCVLIDPEEYTSVDFSLLRRGYDAVAYAVAEAARRMGVTQ
jgi:hypothetical protein